MAKISSSITDGPNLKLEKPKSAIQGDEMQHIKEFVDSLDERELETLRDYMAEVAESSKEMSLDEIEDEAPVEASSDESESLGY